MNASFKNSVSRYRYCPLVNKDNMTAMADKTDYGIKIYLSIIHYIKLKADSISSIKTQIINFIRNNKLLEEMKIVM